MPLLSRTYWEPDDSTEFSKRREILKIKLQNKQRINKINKNCQCFQE